MTTLRSRKRDPLHARQRKLYQQDPVAAITLAAPQLALRLPDTLVRTRVALASATDCPTSVLEMMAAHDTDHVVRAVVSNPNCSVTALSNAAETHYDYYDWSSLRIMASIGQHPRMDVALLRRLAVHRPDLALARPSCPVDLVVTLSRSPSPGLRAMAIAHPSIPTEALLATIGDSDPQVSVEIRWAVAQRGYETIRRALILMTAQNRQRLVRRLDRGDVERLARDPDERIRYAVARVTDDAVLLRQLAGDPHGRVRRAVSDRLVLSLAS